MTWKPHRTLQETEDLLRAPGCVHEVETTLVDGRLYRVYKNLWPSLRDFWLSAVSQYSTDIYIVYEDQRLTYDQVHNRIIQVAASFHQLYGIKKGDSVGICSRNCPDYLVAFWACHLIGAVSVLVNAARQFVRDHRLKYFRGRRRYQVSGDGHDRQNETLARDGIF